MSGSSMSSPRVPLAMGDSMAADEHAAHPERGAAWKRKRAARGRGLWRLSPLACFRREEEVSSPGSPDGPRSERGRKQGLDKVLPVREPEVDKVIASDLPPADEAASAAVTTDPGMLAVDASAARETKDPIQQQECAVRAEPIIADQNAIFAAAQPMSAFEPLVKGEVAVIPATGLNDDEAHGAGYAAETEQGKSVSFDMDVVEIPSRSNGGPKPVMESKESLFTTPQGSVVKPTGEVYEGITPEPSSHGQKEVLLSPELATPQQSLSPKMSSPTDALKHEFTTPETGRAGELVHKKKTDETTEPLWEQMTTPITPELDEEERALLGGFPTRQAERESAHHKSVKRSLAAELEDAAQGGTAKAEFSSGESFIISRELRTPVLGQPGFAFASDSSWISTKELSDEGHHEYSSDAAFAGVSTLVHKFESFYVSKGSV